MKEFKQGKTGCNMDLILINEEKLKIILSNRDMLELNINIESLDYSNVSTKKAFWEILDKAKESTGFNADNSKLFVQVFPSADGGCEMFVTKYNSSETLNKNENKNINKKTVKKIEISKFIVSDYDNISNLCKRITDEGYVLKSHLYITEPKKYILILDPYENMPSFYKGKQNYKVYPEYLTEYGKCDELTQSLRTQIDEYCTLIIKDKAIEILATLTD